MLEADFKEDLFDGVTLVPKASSHSIDREAVFIEESHTSRKKQSGLKTANIYKG